jgi:hypothetical protein
MTTCVNNLLLVCAGIVVFLPVARAADSTLLRTGLWELTLRSDLTAEQARRLSLQLPHSWVAKVPASQRKEVERLYSTGELVRNALNSATTLCITEEELERGIRPGTDLDQPCSVSHASIDSRHQQLQLVCESLGSAARGEAQIDLTVDDPTAFTGKLTRNITGGKPFSVAVELQGIWLDSQCGEEAPEEDETPLR